jgi:hypothetical protein
VPPSLAPLRHVAHRLSLAAVFALAAPAPDAAAQSTQVFATDFEGSLPAEFDAPGASIQPSQGWGPLGHPGNQYGANFLRYEATPLFDTRLVVRDLPPHDRLSLGFLLALIDSWDGTELFRVSVDGQLLWSHWFQLASGDASDYVAPPGTLLSSGTELGFSFGAYYSRDRAYDLSLDSTFIDIPHTADSVVVVWYLDAVSGIAAQQWQGAMDESWAIDNVRVSVRTATAGAPRPFAAPAALAFAAPSPNPARGATTLRFALPREGAARLSVYDAGGRRVRRLVDGVLPAGEHTAAWDLRDDAGRAVGAGLYFARLEHERRVLVRRIAAAR